MAGKPRPVGGLTDEQVALRSSGIGASEIATILGENPYSSPHDLWMDKLGLRPPFKGNAATRAGQMLEPVVADWYSDHTGASLKYAGGETLRHPDHPWMLATPDYLRRSKPHSSKLVAVVEIKTAGVHMAKEWGPQGSDEVPERYILQVHQQMAVLDALGVVPGVQVADIAVLLGGRDFRCYRVERDSQVEEAIIEAGGRFWEGHVLPQDPPPTDMSPGCAAWQARRYANHDDVLVPAMPDLLPWVERYADAKTRAAQASKEQKLAEAHIKEAIGANAGIVGALDGDEFRLTWKQQAGRTLWKGVAEKLTDLLLRTHTADQDEIDRIVGAATSNPARVFRAKL